MLAEAKELSTKRKYGSADSAHGPETNCKDLHGIFGTLRGSTCLKLFQLGFDPSPESWPKEKGEVGQPVRFDIVTMWRDVEMLEGFGRLTSERQAM